MSSLNLINLFKLRDNYDRYHTYINTNALTKEERMLFKDIEKWFNADEENTEIDWNVFRGWFFSVAHPKMGDINTDIYNQILDRLDEYDEPDEMFTKATIDAFLRREACGKISELSLPAWEGDTDIELSEITTVIEDYENLLGRTAEVESYYVNEDIEDLTKAVTEGGYDWRHAELNESIGRLRQGKLIVLGARPNAGKTSFLADNMTHIASQLEDDEVILWFNNEEEGREVKFRLLQSGTNTTAANIKVDPARTKREYESLVGGYNKIVIVDKADLSVQDVEAILKRHKGKVGVIVFDQLWKVHGFENKAGNDAQRLQVLYQWARELAKKHAAVITTHQADYTAEGQANLTMGQLHMNKTGIQGECDTIIMIGRTYEPGEEYFRYFSIAKNKGAYGPVVDPTKNEHQYIKTLKPEVARYV